jgi:hydrophobic/amphiphilic exporter-1 (mainly G- bacteria), HAE1 family
LSLTKTSVSRPVTTAMFFLGIALLGIISLTQISVNFLPSIQIPELFIETDYTNASAAEVEKTITKPVESITSTVDGVSKISSVSRDGESLVTLKLAWGTDVNYTMLEVREKLDELKASLPENVGRSTIYKIDPSTESIMTLAVNFTSRDSSGVINSSQLASVQPGQISGTEDNSIKSNSLLSLKANMPKGGQTAAISQNAASNYALAQLKDFSETVIKKRFEQLNGVSQAVVSGGFQKEIQVKVNPQKLQSFGLNFADIKNALQNSNLNLEGGSIDEGVFRYPLRTIGEFRSISDISSVPVSTKTGSIPLNDVASVYQVFAQREGLTRVNGKEAILLYIKKDAHSNTISLSKKVREAVAQLNNDYPQAHISVIFDQSEFIQRSISDIEQAIVYGALLSLLILFLFLRDPRYPLLVGAVTPFSILATIILMYFFGISFNIISLTGLALGIGMVGDNAIIIVENFSRLREQGSSIVEAVIGGSKEINLSVSAATFTNVAIFLPVIFVKGIAQKLFLDMGLTMTFSLMASLLVSVTLVPSFLAKMKHKEKQNNSDAKKIFAGKILGRKFSTAMLYYEKLKAAYIKILRNFINNPKPVLIGTAILILVSLGTAFLIKSEQAPDIDQSRFVVDLILPPSSTLKAVNKASAKIESLLLTMPQIKDVVADVGISSKEDYFKIISAATNKSEIECRVKPGYTVKSTITYLREKIKNMVPTLNQYSANILITRPSTTFERILQSGKSDIDIDITGKDLETAYKIADSAEARLNHISYLSDVGLGSESAGETNQIILKIDDEKIKAYNITPSKIIDEISGLFQKKTVTYFNDFDKKIAIKVLPASNNQSGNGISYVKNLLDYGIRSSNDPSSPTIPLRELVEVEKGEGFSSIAHEGQQRVVVLHANVTTAGLFQAAGGIQKSLSKINLPTGYQIKIGGRIEDVETTFKSLIIIILLSIFLVYVILASQYESIIYPLVILTTSPLALVGSFIAMYLFGHSYNLMSIVGIIIMLGAIDNDAVIAVDMITSNRKNGVPLADAIVDGMQKRFRPIVMTTLTTIVGMIPLIFGFGGGLALAAAISYPIIGGLIGSTVFTLFLIPVLYRYFDKLKM